MSAAVTAQRLSGVSPDDADAVFAAAAPAVRAGQEDAALPLLERAVVLNPADARLWQLIGLAHRRREDSAPAIAAFEKAAVLAPADALIAHGLARTTLEAGLPAVELFERAGRLAPSDGALFLGHVAALYAERGLAKAVAALEARLEREPAWLPGHGTLSRLRWMRGERENFAASYAAAAAASPRDVAVWRDWIETLMHAGRHEEALGLIARGRAAAGASMVFDALETLATCEAGETAEADRMFAGLGPIAHVSMAARYMRHLLRAGRPVEAARFGENWLADSQAELVWPYLASAWRLTGDERWQSLEGDERLVGVYDLADKLPSLPALAEALRALHRSSAQMLEQSVRGGTQTDGPLFARLEPEIRALRAAIVEAVESHVAQLPEPRERHPTLIAARGPVRFAGSWSVRLPGSGFHSNHVHPAGWLSSAFYVALPEAMGGEEKQGWLTLGAPQAELGLDLAPSRSIEPKPGRLVLFPSTMWHGTIPFAEGERLTVAFDVARPVT